MLPEVFVNKTMDLQKHQKKQEVYKYIQDHVVGDGGVDALGKYYASPIHTVMTLMGCYGDRWDKNTNSEMSLQDLLAQNFMKPDKDSQSKTAQRNPALT